MSNQRKRLEQRRLRASIVDAYPAESIRAIAKRVDVSVRQVRAVLKSAGVDLRPVGRPPAAAELPDVAARLRTLPAPSPAPGPPPFPVPSPALPVAQTSPAEPAPEPAAAQQVSALERRIFDFGKKLDDPRPVLWRCPACRRPIHERGQTSCRCGWAFITGYSDAPRRRRQRPPSNIVVAGYDLGPANWPNTWP